MSFLETKKLYRIEITERCYHPPPYGTGTAMPSFKNDNFGSMPKGITGCVVEKLVKKYRN
ncbi:hypothetical protein [Clostridium drakei]|uniref:Uncharacterized protein n=1 Tax=Clostridium drakei TaxID=332101 RepID=A0A2U8DNQ3_9CLOT|nr:hypothetical protein [Clostridium drakei]AWI04397.1 hypothetical protein B9W14_07770 [Clostridium drakei]